MGENVYEKSNIHITPDKLLIMKDINDMTDDELREAGYTFIEEAEAWRQKRERQARDRQLIKDGIRTQESMFLIPREIAKTSTVRYRGFDLEDD